MNKIYKELNRQSFVNQIREIENEGNEVKQITPYQYRINGQLDIYPSSKRFFVLDNKKRGDIETSFIDFIIDFFNKKYHRKCIT